MAEEIDGLREAAYAAAIDPSGWADWVHRTGRWFGAHTAYMGIVDRSLGAIVWDHLDHPDPVMLDRYYSDELYRLDPQIAVTMRMTRSRLYRDTDVLDRDDPDTRRFVRRTAEEGGIGHYATFAAVLDGGRFVGGLSLHNAVRDGVTSAEQVRRLAALAPSIEGALGLGVLHARKLAERWWDGRLEGAVEPTALLDERGRVLRATPSLEAILRTDDGLSLLDQHLHAADSSSEARLAAAIERATRRGAPVADAARVLRRFDRAPYVVAIWPVVAPMRAMVPDRAAALLTVVDPLATPPARPALWRAAFALTAREAELANWLMKGHSPESAAAALGISIATVRVHLRQLLAKTGTTRQVDLIRLLTRIG